MKMKRFGILLLLLLSLNSMAQQDALYSQYMFNPFAINPGYAGSREAVSAVLLHRSQWVGFEGAPSTQTLAIHSPIKNKRMALGLNVSNDAVGPVRNLGAAATYAYHLPFSTGKLSLALRGGIYSSNLDRSTLEFQDPTDQYNGAGTINSTVPTFDFGAYYYTRRFYAGMAITHLSQQQLGYVDQLNNNGGAGDGLRRHFMLASGYAMDLNDNIIFKPSVLIKYVDAAPLNVDVNASFLINKVFWLGASYRTSGDLVLLTEFNITDYLRVGYSYDLVLNQLQTYQRGSHELFVGFDFALSKSQVVSPRFL